MDVNVLGTTYKLLESSQDLDENLKQGIDGYTDTSVHVCVVDSMNDAVPGSKADLKEYKKQVMRHELIHAFLHESGLDANSWADNEELVDWIAIQFPKLQKAFEDAGCI